MQNIFLKLNKKIPTLAFIGLLLLFTFIVFYKIGSKPLQDYDEGIYAQVAKEALLSHHQLSFTWLGNQGLGRSPLWFEKPPLMIWLTELSYKAFGVNEFAARFWVGIFSVAIFILVYFTAKLLFKSQKIALVSSSLLFISFQFIYNTAVLQFDLPVTFFVLLTIFSFYLSLKVSNKFYYLFWAALGLGVLTKSVIGLLPLPIVFLYSLIYRDFSYLKLKQFYNGLVLFLVIILPWHIIETIKYGKVFWGQYLFYHVLERFAQPMEGNKGTFWFYWDILYRGKLLISFTVISIVYFLFSKKLKLNSYGLIFIATIFTFLFFSSAKTKLPAYILVLYPFLVILVGAAIVDLLDLLRAKYSQILTAILMIGFVFLGIKYNNYRLLQIKDPYLVDTKAAGLYLAKNYVNLPVYYYSTTGTKPATIFYSNRVVNYLSYPSPKPTSQFLLLSEVAPNYTQAEKVFTTQSQTVYLVK